MNIIEAMKQALDALEDVMLYAAYPMYRKQAADLKQAIEEVESKETDLVTRIEKYLDQKLPSAKTEVDLNPETFLRLIETINYMKGIAERGRGHKCPDDMSAEKFLLDYVIELEGFVAKVTKAEPVAWLFTGIKPGEHRQFSSVDDSMSQTWPTDNGFTWTREPLYLHPAPSLEGWQPIETAPRDGTRVLVYFNTMANWNRVEIAWFGVDPNDGDDDPCWLFGDGDDFSTGYYYTPITPTHWMPLPAPPEYKP